MLKKNIHLLTDSIYSNWFVELCDKNLNGSINEFYCLSHNTTYINKNDIKCLPSDNEIVLHFIKELNNTKQPINLYVHYLDEIKASIINGINNQLVTIIWIIWSDDLYALPKLKFKKHDRYSASFLTNIENKKSIKQRIGRLKMIYIDGIDLNFKKKWSKIYRAINKINYCSTGIAEEVRIVQKKLNANIKLLPFAYISVLNGLPITNDTLVDKTLIQVGNSADPSNNHYEVFEKLKKIKINSEILLPLSYGNEEYKTQLLKDIVNLIEPSKLSVLTTLLEKQVYYNQLQKVKSAIFAHNIQQAFGNIIALIYFGAKVFLKNENPLFQQFQLWHIKVYSIEKEMNYTEITTTLPLEIKIKNKLMCLELFSEKKINEYYRYFLSI